MAMLIKIKCNYCNKISEIEGIKSMEDLADDNEICPLCGSNNTEVYETDSLN